MAHTMGTNIVRSSIAEASQEGANTFTQNGAIVMTTVDITSYPTGGETVTAGELGLQTIWGVIAQCEELAGTANNNFVSGVPVAADGKSCIFECQLDDGTSGVPAESANTTNIGIITVTAFGQIAGTTSNV